jgi:lambda family phage portal protein
MTASGKSNVLHVAFDAGKTGRRLRAIPTSRLAINSQIRSYGKNVVARSRYLCVNNPYASLAKEEFVSAFVGSGIKPSSLNPDVDVKREIHELFKEWTDEADADGLTDYYGLQGIIGGEMFEAGECFVRLRPRLAKDGLSVPLQLQLLPSEMCPTDYNVTLGAGRRIECGIQFDAIGRREGYWFYRTHPGEMNPTQAATFEKVFVPADQVLHLFKPIRAGQIRGVPHTLSGMITLAILDLYDDAELERKRTAALFTAFLTRKPGEEDGDSPFAGAPGETSPKTGQNNMAMEPGATVELEEGQDIKFSEPADVGANFEAFEYRQLLRAAAGFGTPYANMTGDLRQTSYGSQRGGLVSFRRKIETMQNSVMIFQFCRPIMQRWMTAAVLSRSFLTINPTEFAANPRPFLRFKHITPRWEWIDPLKDLMAEKLAVDSGFKSRSDVIEATGEEPEEVDARILEDQERASRLGLKFTQLANSIVVSPDDSEPESLVAEPAPPDNTPAKSDNSKAAAGKLKITLNGTRRKSKSGRYIWDC